MLRPFCLPVLLFSPISFRPVASAGLGTREQACADVLVVAAGFWASPTIVQPMIATNKQGGDTAAHGQLQEQGRLLLRCAEPGVCPGGAAGACRGDRAGPGCEQCAADIATTEGSWSPGPFGGPCSKCGPLSVLLNFAIITGVVGLVLMGVHRLIQGMSVHELDPALLLALPPNSFGVLLFSITCQYLQLVALSVDIACAAQPELLSTIHPDPEIVRKMRTIVSLLLFDTRALRPECIMDWATHSHFSSRLLIDCTWPLLLFVSAVFFGFLCRCGSRVISRITSKPYLRCQRILLETPFSPVSITHQLLVDTLESLRTFTFVFSTALYKVAFRCLECTEHPNDVWFWNYASLSDAHAGCHVGRSAVTSHALAVHVVYTLLPTLYFTCFFLGDKRDRNICSRPPCGANISPKMEDTSKAWQSSFLSVQRSFMQRPWPFVVLFRNLICSGAVAVCSNIHEGEFIALLLMTTVEAAYIYLLIRYRPWRHDAIGNLDSTLAATSFLVAVASLVMASHRNISAVFVVGSVLRSTPRSRVVTSFLVAACSLFLFVVALQVCFYLLRSRKFAITNTASDGQDAIDQMGLAADLMKFALSLCAADHDTYQQILVRMPKHQRNSAWRAIRIVQQVMEECPANEGATGEQRRQALHSLSLQCAHRFAMPLSFSEPDEIDKVIVNEPSPSEFGGSQDLHGFQSVLDTPSVERSRRSSANSMPSMRDLLGWNSGKRSVLSSRRNSAAKSQIDAATKSRRPSLRTGASTPSDRQLSEADCSHGNCSSPPGATGGGRRLPSYMTRSHRPSIGEIGHISQLGRGETVVAPTQRLQDNANAGKPLADHGGLQSNDSAIDNPNDAIAEQWSPSSSNLEAAPAAVQDGITNQGDLDGSETRSLTLHSVLSGSTDPSGNDVLGAVAVEQTALAVQRQEENSKDTSGDDRKQQWLARKERRLAARNDPSAKGAMYGNWLRAMHANKEDAASQLPCLLGSLGGAASAEDDVTALDDASAIVASVSISNTKLKPKESAKQSRKWKTYVRKSAVGLFKRYQRRDRQRELQRRAEEVNADAVASHSGAVGNSSEAQADSNETSQGVDSGNDWEQQIRDWRLDPRGCQDQATVERLRIAISQMLPGLSGIVSMLQDKNEISVVPGSSCHLNEPGDTTTKPTSSSNFAQSLCGNGRLARQSLAVKLSTRRRSRLTSYEDSILTADSVCYNIESALPDHSGLSTVQEQSYASSMQVSRRQSGLSSAVSDLFQRSRSSSIFIPNVLGLSGTTGGEGNAINRRASTLMGGHRQSVLGNLMPTREETKDDEELGMSPSAVTATSLPTSNSAVTATSSADGQFPPGFRRASVLPIGEELVAGEEQVGEQQSHSSRKSVVSMIGPAWHKGEKVKNLIGSVLGVFRAARLLHKSRIKDFGAIPIGSGTREAGSHCDPAVDMGNPLASCASSGLGSPASGSDEDEVWVDSSANYEEALSRLKEQTLMRDVLKPPGKGSQGRLENGQALKTGEQHLSDGHEASNACIVSDDTAFASEHQPKEGMPRQLSEPCRRGTWFAPFSSASMLWPTKKTSRVDGLHLQQNDAAPPLDRRHSTMGAAVLQGIHPSPVAGDWLFPQSSMLGFVNSQAYCKPRIEPARPPPDDDVMPSLAYQPDPAKLRSGNQSRHSSFSGAASSAAAASGQTATSTHSDPSESNVSVSTEVLLHGLLDDISREQRSLEVPDIFNRGTRHLLVREGPPPSPNPNTLGKDNGDSTTSCGTPWKHSHVPPLEHERQQMPQREDTSPESSPWKKPVLRRGESAAESSGWSAPVSNASESFDARVDSDAASETPSTGTGLGVEAGKGEDVKASDSHGPKVRKLDEEAAMARWRERREQKRQRRKDGFKRRSASSDWNQTSRGTRETYGASIRALQYGSNSSIASSRSRSSTISLRSQCSSSVFIVRAEPAEAVTMKRQNETEVPFANSFPDESGQSSFRRWC